MSLVQHPQHPSSFRPQCYRGHPSAPPAVIVQPTRTPGLLAMSKVAPTTASSSRKAARSSPKTKHATAVAVMAPQHTPTKSLVAAAAKPVSNDRQNRAPSSPERRKAHSKRTTPSQAPQAEALSTDPFFSPPTISNLSRPSGNLAKRRASQSNAAFPPPIFAPGPFGGMAKSAPTGLLSRPNFVICDDSSDDDLSLSPPSTPVKNRRTTVDSGFAFEDSPAFKALNKSKSPKQHKRRASHDVGGLIMGHWSGDEDSSPSSSVNSFALSTPSRVSTPGTIYDEDDIRYAMPKSHSSPLAGCLPRPAF